MVRAPRRGRRQRTLGQNFLADPNILDVIERLAGVEPQDVVLEVGGGVGVLSRRLAAAARHLHVVEVDRRCEAALREALAPSANWTLHVGDALALDLAGLDPPPQRMVANLPYGIAATLILRTVEELPELRHWTVMVQREVGERLAARPGTPAYGAPSALAQLSCEVQVLRAVSRTVFRPVPNVDSVLVGLRRIRGEPEREVRRLVRDAFAHRRKSLARSVALVRGDAPGQRERLREALLALGHPAEERAERLAPEEFRALAGDLG